MDKQSTESILEGLRSQDLPLRIDSFTKLRFIAEAIGPERTRNELLPYIQQFADDEDAILLEIVNQLSTITTYIGGPQYLQYTFDILEIFMLHDEPQVRTRAVDVFISYFPQLDSIQVVRYVLPVIRHLVLSEWHVGRLSATTLLPHIYPLCSTQLQNELCAIFSALALDEHPSVRKAICQQFGLFGTFCLNDPKLARILYHLVIHASKDIQDSVRMAAVDSCIIVSDILRHYHAQHKALTILFSLTTDISWRVRYVVARRYPLILASLDMTSFSGDETAEYFAKLLQDHESEVRTAAASVLGRVCCLLGHDKTLRYLVPLLKPCSEDVHDSVRIALSRDFLYTCNTLPQYIVNETILPLFQQLLSDSRSEVKLNLMSNIDLLKPHVTEESLFTTMLPSIIELSQHTNWRIRVNVTSQYVILAKQLSREAFVQRLLPIAMCQLCDPVASVRYGAISNFFKFTIVYGIEWCQTHLLPRLQILSEHQSFTHRLSAALALTGLLQILPLTTIHTTVYPILSSLLNDRVTNIQLLALRGVALILSRLLQFAPHEHVWLQQDQLFSFSDNVDQKGNPIPGDSSLVLHVLLHNIKQRVFWEQIQCMLPTVTNNKITLEQQTSSSTATAATTTTPLSTPSKLPSELINPNPHMMSYVKSTAGQTNNIKIPSMSSLLDLTDDKFKQSSIFADTNPSSSTTTHITSPEDNNINNNNDDNNNNNSMSQTYYGPQVQHDTFSDLIALLKSPDFLDPIPNKSNDIKSTTSPSSSSSSTTTNSIQSPLIIANNEAETLPTLTMSDQLIQQTVQDTSLSLREFMKILGTYIKKSNTNQKIFQQITNVTQDPPSSQQQSSSSSALLHTLPFHLLSSTLSPTPGAVLANTNNGTNQNRNSEGAAQPTAPKHGTELYIFLLLKRLREDYRKIIRESINVILLKLKDIQPTAIRDDTIDETTNNNNGDVPEQETEASLLNELNYLRSLLTTQYQQDLKQDPYLFHTTPVIYQLQHQKHIMMTEVIEQDAQNRNQSIMIQFRAQLLNDLERFRYQKTRGGGELTVFANETFRLISQLAMPLLQQ